MNRRQLSKVTADLPGGVSEWADNVRFDAPLAQKWKGGIPPCLDARRYPALFENQTS